MAKMPDEMSAARRQAQSFQPDMTTAAALDRATSMLRAAHIDGAARDARLLIAAALAVEPLRLIAHPEQRLGSDAANRASEFVGRRCRSEPVSRILGVREFYGRPFRITPTTLDPRADSETLIEAALGLVGAGGPLEGIAPLRVLDVGTGSGCLIVTLLAELPAAIGLATDIDPSALAVALSNAERHGVADRLTVKRADALEGIPGPFDLIVSNPPYIQSAVIGNLAPDVRDFDPRIALDGGFEGLSFYRRLAASAGSRLTREPAHGWLVCEIGAGQEEEVERLFVENGFASPCVHMDLEGHTRCVAATPLD